MDRQPRVMPGGYDLLYGAIRTPADSLHANANRADVRLLVDGVVVSRSVASERGYYSLLVKSTQWDSAPVLQIVKEDGCVHWNATRVVSQVTKPDGGSVLWKYDVVLAPGDAYQRCETGSTLSPVNTIGTTDLERQVGNAVLGLGVVWALFTLWAIAHWASSQRVVALVEPSSSYRCQQTTVSRKIELSRGNMHHSTSKSSKGALIVPRPSNVSRRRMIARPIDEDEDVISTIGQSAKYR